MSSVVRGDLDAMMRLRVGLVTSASKYASEANLIKTAAGSLEGASETNAHELAAEQAREAAARLEGVGNLLGDIADQLTPEIERLSALIDLTRRA